MTRFSFGKYTARCVAGLVYAAVLLGNPRSHFSGAHIALAQEIDFDASNTTVVLRVAPGDFLPIAVKLLNFGSDRRVDVAVTYTITDSSLRTIATDHETVAVETTASFVKKIQIPPGIDSGIYVAHASVAYPDQEVPATTQFSFTVEHKYLGLFESDLITYGGLTVLFGVLMGIFGHIFVKRVRLSRFSPIDYKNISKDDRVFYELISDTVLGMHEKVGDVAFDIAGSIPGMKIDSETGRVLSLTDKPSKIVAALVSEYEKALGKKVSFEFRRDK